MQKFYWVNIFMKNALILGGGSKWGAFLTATLTQNNYHVDLISSSNYANKNVTTYSIDWHNCKEQDIDSIVSSIQTDFYDIIFFNQNSGGGPNDEFYAPGNDFPLEYWNKAFWLDCQITYYIVKKLSSKITDNTKIGWMLTGLINGADPDYWKFAGYASVKSTNLHMMRGFAKYHPGIFFCIQPIWFPQGEEEKDAKDILQTIEHLNPNDSGYVFNKDGSRWA